MNEFEAAFDAWVAEGAAAQENLLPKGDCLSFEALSSLESLPRKALEHLDACVWCLGVRERFSNLSSSVQVVSAEATSLKLEQSPSTRRLSLVDAESGARVQSLEVEHEPEPGRLRLRQALDSETIEKLKSHQYLIGLE